MRNGQKSNKSNNKKHNSGTSKSRSFLERFKAIVKSTKTENSFVSKRSSNIGPSFRNSQSDTFLHLNEKNKFLQQIEKQEQMIRELQHQNQNINSLFESIDSIKQTSKQNNQFFMIFCGIAAILFLTYISIIPILIINVSSLTDETSALAAKLNFNFSKLHIQK